MNILAAKVCPVKIGHRSIQGLLGSDGKFYVAVPQLATLEFVPPNRSAKQLEALIGLPSASHVKLRTELNSKPVNAIPITLFEVLIAKLDRMGNVPAQEFRDSLVGLSLHQLFCDAFEIEFKKSDRQEWLKERMESKQLYRSASECVAAWMESRSCSAPDFVYYAKLGDAFNLSLFGKTSKEIRSELKVKGLIRDCFGDNALKAIVHLETTAVHLWKQYPTVAPHECVRKAASFLGLHQIDYRR